MLIGLAAKGTLAPAVGDAVSQFIFRNPDVGVRALASQYFKRPAADGTAFPPVSELLRLQGDVTRGREVFSAIGRPAPAATSMVVKGAPSAHR